MEEVEVIQDVMIRVFLKPDQNDVIEQYQEAYRWRYGQKITKAEVVQKAVYTGIDPLKLFIEMVNTDKVKIDNEIKNLS